MTRPARLRHFTAATVALTATVFCAVPAGAASDTKLAKQGTIVATDVPSTWTSSPDDDSGDKRTDKLAAKVSDCKDFLAVRKIEKASPTAESRDFTDGRNQLSNEVVVYGSVAKAEKVFELISSSTIAACINTVYKKAFEQTLPKTVTDVQVRIEQATDLSALDVDDGIAYGGPVQVTEKDGTVTALLLAVIGVRVGKSILSYSLIGSPTSTGQFDPAFASVTTSAIDGTVARMKDALA